MSIRHMMKEQDFIQAMVTDTLSLGKIGSKGNFLYDTDNIREIVFEYDRKKQCFWIKNFNKQTLEIPENFGPFKHRLGAEFILDDQSDKCGLLAVLSAYLDTKLKVTKITLHKGHEQQLSFDLPDAA